MHTFLYVILKQRLLNQPGLEMLCVTQDGLEFLALLLYPPERLNSIHLAKVFVFVTSPLDTQTQRQRKKLPNKSLVLCLPNNIPVVIKLPTGNFLERDCVSIRE